MTKTGTVVPVKEKFDYGIKEINTVDMWPFCIDFLLEFDELIEEIFNGVGKGNDFDFVKIIASVLKKNIPRVMLEATGVEKIGSILTLPQLIDATEKIIRLNYGENEQKKIEVWKAKFFKKQENKPEQPSIVAKPS